MRFWFTFSLIYLIFICLVDKERFIFRDSFKNFLNISFILMRTLLIFFCIDGGRTYFELNEISKLWLPYVICSLNDSPRWLYFWFSFWINSIYIGFVNSLTSRDADWMERIFHLRIWKMKTWEISRTRIHVRIMQFWNIFGIILKYLHDIIILILILLVNLLQTDFVLLRQKIIDRSERKIFHHWWCVWLLYQYMY